jgi:hypothetical protein
MPIPNQPTLLYPVGGEKIDSTNVVVRWTEPPNASQDAIFAELRVAQGDDILDDSKSYVIGRVVPGIKSFIWNVSPNFSGADMRVSVRLVGSDGSRSASSISYAPFTVVRNAIPVPVLISPKPNDVISSSALIILDDAPYSLLGNARIQYSIYASSESASAYYIPVMENIAVGTPSILWNIEGLRNASDWYLNIFASDDQGVRSPTLNVGPLTLGNPGFIIFDTEPPEITVRIQGDEFYTKRRDISVQVYAEDSATSIHAMKIQEKAETDSGIVDREESVPKIYSVDNIFTLSNQDEKKIISIYAQDYGANRTDLSNPDDFFSTKKPNLFREVIKLDSNSTFRTVKYEDGGNRFIAVVASSISNVDSIVLVDARGMTFLASSENPVISIGIDGPNIYASVGNASRTMDVRIITNGSLVEKFSDTSLGSEATAIGSDAFGNLYIGCADGRLFLRSGSTLSLIAQLDGTVTSIVRSSGGSALICAGNSNSIYMANSSLVTLMEVTI